MKPENCPKCNKEMIYDSDIVSLAWNHSYGMMALCYEIQQQNPDMKRKIMRADLKGYWYCPNKRHKEILIDIKRQYNKKK